jgi:hypothetical protein
MKEMATMTNPNSEVAYSILVEKTKMMQDELDNLDQILSSTEQHYEYDSPVFHKQKFQKYYYYNIWEKAQTPNLAHLI